MSDAAVNLPAPTLTPSARNPVNPALLRTVKDPLTAKKREQISAYTTICETIDKLPGASRAQKTAQFQAEWSNGQLSPAVLAALSVLRGKKTSCPDRATLYRWLQAADQYANGNVLALTRKYQGRPLSIYGWEAKALELYQQPSKPGCADVAFWLRTDHGFASATKSRVTRYLQTLPETLGKQSAKRMGKQFYRHNLSPYKIRDNDVLPVGFGYEGDGHTVDVYVAHPSTGQLYRPELTVWIDVRSRLIVGWYLSDAESAISTLFALSHAILSHDHVPAVLFLDNGSGFKARMMSDAITGFFTRLSITPNWVLPGNSKGKGLVEGFFKLFRNRHDKKYATYCGDDMAEEVNRRLADRVKRGLQTLPALTEYVESVRAFILAYNLETKPVLNGLAPQTLWECELNRVPVHIEADALVQPRVLRTVKKWRIRLDNRYYQAAELAQYNNTDVLVEYSLHDDQHIRVLDEQERLICKATLVGKIDRLPASRIEEAEQKRLQGQLKRLQNKADEQRLRAQPVISSNDAHLVLDVIPERVIPAFNPEDALCLGTDEPEASTHTLNIEASF